MMVFQTQPPLEPTVKSITFVNPINQYILPNLQKQNKQLLYNNPNVANASQIIQVNKTARRYRTPIQIRPNLVNGINTIPIKSFNTLTAYNPPKQLPNQNYITRTFTNQNKINNLNIVNPLINGKMNKISNNQVLINGGLNNHVADQNLVNKISTIKSQNVVKNISNGQNVIINNVNNNTNSINIVPIQKVINPNIIKNPNMINGMVTNQNPFKSINGAPTNISLAINNNINPLVKPVNNSINAIPKVEIVNSPNNTNISVNPKVIGNIANNTNISAIPKVIENKVNNANISAIPKVIENNVNNTNISAIPKVIGNNMNNSNINAIPRVIGNNVNNANINAIPRVIGNNVNNININAFPKINVPVSVASVNNPLLIQKNLINNNALPLNQNLREPYDIVNLGEYRVLNEIGEGTFGKIYKVIWVINNKLYALKKEILRDIEAVKIRQHRNEAIRAFTKLTNCRGIVHLFGNLTIPNGHEYLYFELMELCDKDFEKEVKERAALNRFYTEQELDNIMIQLISTLAFLQKMHITHRDIKPQNILISNGIYKLCDFGDIRVMQREGIVVQRVRGSELYMSPILFKGLRDKAYHVKHNTYKSDVFSLGMVFLLAACLSFDGCVEIREILDMNQKELILNKHLGRRYSPKFIKILLLMLQTEEINRPDFILLDAAIKQYGL